MRKFLFGLLLGLVLSVSAATTADPVLKLLSTTDVFCIYMDKPDSGVQSRQLYCLDKRTGSPFYAIAEARTKS